MLRFRVRVLRFRVRVLRFRVQVLRFRVRVLRFRVFGCFVLRSSFSSASFSTLPNEFSGIPSRKRLRDFESVTIDTFAPGQRELTFWTSPVSIDRTAHACLRFAPFPANWGSRGRS